MWIGNGIALIAVLVAIAASWLLYGQTLTLLTENLRERLQTISITEAANIDAKDLAALQVEGDWQKPEWARVVNSLHRAKYGNKNVVFMYIFRKTKADPTQMEFMGDADSLNPYANTDNNPNNNVDVNGDGKIEPDGPDKLQWPGQPYSEAVDLPEAYAAYNGPLTVKDLYTDAYGTVLTGYSPIKDENGNTVAVLGTDIKADDFFTVTRQTLYPFLIFIAFLICIISILAVTLVYMWRRRAKELTKMDELKDEFLSVATHQLRAPITAIRGSAANILEGTYGAIPEYLTQPLSVINESSRLMANSVEDYLNISRIEQGRMKYEKSTFDIVTVVQKIVSSLAPTAEAKKLALSSVGEEKINVYADVGKVNQIITNLVDNAIKYTNTGNITVSVERKGTMARVVVSDTGVGISNKDIGILFEKFVRTRNANKVNTTGSGLGLYVAKMLTLGNSGNIWIESGGVGKGSRFIVELPVSQGASPTA